MTHEEAIVDAIVIGGGIAGMVASNRLVQLGKTTLVLEQGAEAEYLCNSRFTGGAVHVGFRDPVSRTPDELLAEINSRSRIAKPELAEAVAHDARRVIAWLREQGVRFAKAGAEEYKAWVLMPFRSNSYGLDWRGRGGDVALRTLGQVLLSRGGVLQRGVRALALDITHPDYVAVEAMEGDRKRQYRARAVVIADGGFQGNPDLIRKFIMPKPEALMQRGAGTGRGDGLRMATEVGAATVGTKRFYGHCLSKDAFENNKLWPFPVVDPIVHAGIVIDGSAKRFVDEGEGGVWVANNIAWLADPLSAVVIFDDAIWRGPAAKGVMAPNPNMISAGGHILDAATLSELAAVIGVPAAALVRTVEEYNAACAAQTLARLNPVRTSVSDKPMPILKAPFHAVRLCAGITFTMGGIAIDGQSRVLNEQGKPIPRLFAAGCCTGGLEGGPTGGYVGGLTKSGVTGLRAAECIAGYTA